MQVPSALTPDQLSPDQRSPNQFTTSQAGPATPEALTDETVRAAIDALVEALVARKDPVHFWDPPVWGSGHGSAYQQGGYTALVSLALLHAGVSWQDPRLRDAIEHLETAELEGTYAVACRALVWSRLPDRFLPKLRADARWLAEGYSEHVGGWSYDGNARTRRVDNSLRQYGLLGLWAAARRGIPIDDRIWRGIEAGLLSTRQPDGGWTYDGSAGPSTGSMTAAGLMGLLVIDDLLHGPERRRLRPPVRRSGPAPDETRSPTTIAIDEAFDWFARSFSARENPNDPAWFYYYLYGVERVGLAGGRRRLGTHDWFRSGASSIIERLLAPVDVAAGGEEETRFRLAQPTIRNDRLAFALLFLSRGRVPIAVSKLGDRAQRWRTNNRPQDVAHFVDRLSGRLEQELAWQSIDWSEPTEVWLEAPVLYLASDESLPWLEGREREVLEYRRAVRAYLDARREGSIDPTSQPPPRPEIRELERLRMALDRGATLLAMGEGGRDFATSIEAAGSIMYPQHPWTTVRANHPIAGLVEGGRLNPPLRVLSNGVRPLIVLCPRDLAGDLQRTGRTPFVGEDTLVAVFLAATERGRLRPRLERPMRLREPAERLAGPGRVVRLVRAVHAGNWKPEPLAHDVLAEHLSRADPDAGRGPIRLVIDDVPLSRVADAFLPAIGASTSEPGDSNDRTTASAARPSLVHVAGIEAFEPSDAELDALEAVVRAGGTVLIETVGGRGEFADALAPVLAERLGSPLEPLLRGPLLSGAGVPGGADVARASHRLFVAEQEGHLPTTPRLRVVMVDDRPVVVVSGDDLTFALLDRPAWGVIGIESHDARGLWTNLLLLADGAMRSAANAEEGP